MCKTCSLNRVAVVKPARVSLAKDFVGISWRNFQVGNSVGGLGFRGNEWVDERSKPFHSEGQIQKQTCCKKAEFPLLILV